MIKYSQIYISVHNDSYPFSSTYMFLFLYKKQKQLLFSSTNIIYYIVYLIIMNYAIIHTVKILHCIIKCLIFSLYFHGKTYLKNDALEFSSAYYCEGGYIYHFFVYNYYYFRRKFKNISIYLNIFLF